MEADATFTDKDVELYERATAAGIPTVIVSMYKTALQKLIADENEVCAKICDEIEKRKWLTVQNGGKLDGIGARDCAAAIRARGGQK